MDNETDPAVGTNETDTHVAEQQPAIVETTEQQPSAPEEGQGGPSKEDLTKGIAKWRNHAKEMEAEVAKLRAQVPSTPGAPIQPQAAPLSPEENAGVRVISDQIAQQLAPIREQLDASNRERVTEKFWQDPTARAMAPEIQKEFNSPALQTLPYEQRLEVAKGLAINNNITAFQKVYEQRGVDKAYNNQSLKNGQKSENVAGARQLNVEQKTLLEKLQSGEIRPGSPEYVKNRSAILALEKEQFSS